MTGDATVLAPAQRAFVAAARRATLATTAPDGRPRMVPVCFVLVDDVVYSPIDGKPKRHADPRALARVRDLLDRPSVSLLVDRWDEDWDHLGWVRLGGRATLLEPVAAEEHRGALAALRLKYPQYESHSLEERPIIRVTVERIAAWGELDA